jgi:hypothetical protein
VAEHFLGMYKSTIFCSSFCVVVPRALWRKAYCCRVA